MSPAIFLTPKWRITLVFTVLATTVCIVLGAATQALFYRQLTEALDSELQALANELGAFVNLSEETSDLDLWKKARAKSALKSLVSIAFYDAQGRPVDTYGDFVWRKVAADRSERVQDRQRLRFLSRKLEHEGRLIGWLQIAVPTDSRDRAMWELRQLMGVAAPAAVICFTIAGYYFAGWAIRPIEEASAALKRFMTDASHELKTPLSIAQTHSEALEVELKEQAVTSCRLAVLRGALSRMQQLIEDLVVLTQAEAPQIWHPRDDVFVDRIISSVVDDFRDKCLGKKIELTWEAPSGMRLRCDAEGIRRVVSNLLENAWRYTEPGGQIVVSASSGSNELVITVTDTGVGIPAEAQPHIFERFYRVEGSRSRKHGGSGLGLAIVKAIVDTHRGKVSVHSSPEAGSTFTVTLPLA